MSERTLRILIADDDVETQIIFSEYLTYHGYETLVAADGEEALALAATHPLDLALVDVRMPGPSGRALAAQLKALHPTIKVIIVTAHGTISDTVKAMRQGIFDYLEKPVRPPSLLAVVQDALAARQTGAWVQVGELVVDLQKKQAILRNEPLALTVQEFGLLACLARRRGRPVSYAELAARVWDCLLDDSTRKQVQMAVSRLRRKLGDDPAAPRYIVSVRGVGYRLK